MNIEVFMQKIITWFNQNRLFKLIIIFFVCIFCLSSCITIELNAKDKLVYDIEKNIKKRYAYKLTQYLIYNEGKVDTNNITEILFYLKDNPWYEEEILKSLKQQLKTNDLSDKYIFEIKKYGENLFGFDKYKVNINPTYIQINTKYKNTKIYVDNKMVGISDKENYEQRVGPYLLGKHKIVVVYDEKYKKEEIINCYNINDNEMFIEISPEIEYFKQ